MTVILTTGVTLAIGKDVSDCYQLPNVRRIKWDVMPAEWKPAFAMNQTTPLDFNRPHKWLKGEIHCTSEAWHAMYNNTQAAFGNATTQSTGGTAYINPSGDNPPVPYVYVTMKDSKGGIWTYLFSPNIFFVVADPGDYEVDKEVVRVYPFVAAYVTETGYQSGYTIVNGVVTGGTTY